MNLPCRWGEGGLGGLAGRVRFRRRFGWPGRIDAHERVWLTFAGVDGSADLSLNGHPLGRHGPAAGLFEYEVTALLRPRNELVVEVEAPDDRGGLSGEVALEVRCSAFLRNLHAELTPTGDAFRLHVAGEVIGTSDRPLELYALLDGATVLYATVEPAVAGNPFQLTSDVLPMAAPAGPHEVRIELVDAATAWYTAAFRLSAVTQPG
jgi:hypothetical protein